MFKKTKNNIKISLIILVIFLIYPIRVEAGKKKKEVEIDLPTPKYTLIKYNNPAGSKNINLTGLINKKFLNLNGVVSPDLSKMAYTEVYFYPNNNQISSSLFLIPLNRILSPVERILKASVADKINIPVLMSGMNTVDTQIFRTLTVVDWSTDNKKLLIKEKVGENQRSMWATNVWVHDFDTGKSKRLDEVRAAIKYYWKNSQNLCIDNYKWDIMPMGWDLYNPDRIIIYSYGFYNGEKKFLGAWSIDYNGKTTLLLSLTRDNFQVSQNGFELKIIEE